ncbi:STAS domain-containing protein [bacterium]|nr:STAS domain-containing protein [bacterium]
MRIQPDLIDGWLKNIAIEGELDAYTAPRLLEAITAALDEGVAWLVIDMRQAEYIDSVALGILIGGVKRAGEKNGDLAVVCGRPNIRRVFDVSGTAELLNVQDDFGRAVETLAGERAARGGCQATAQGGAGQ